MHFFERIEAIVDDKGSALCVGLDPYFDPSARRAAGDEACLRKALESNLRIIEATSPYAACFKPNVAFYETFGPCGLELLASTIQAIPSGIPCILDAKRGDIDSTAIAYAEAVFGRFGADCVTLNPYMGRDTIDPFLAWKDKGVFTLAKTSNPGSGAFQNLSVGGEPFYLAVARKCATWSDRVGLVVAGNDPEALAAVRSVAPGAWFLSPGIGAQGGRAEDAFRAGSRADGKGILVVAARAVAKADDPAAAARSLRDEMRAASRVARPVGRGIGPRSPETALKDELCRHLVATGCFRLGSFVLKSGKTSPFYIDLRRLISDPRALRASAKAYASMASSLDFARLAGIPAAALPLSTAAGLELDVPTIWPRMPVKDHGTGNRVEGEFRRGERVLLVDDLITTGASKIEAIEILRGEGLVVEDLAVLIERGSGGRADMEKLGVRLHAFIHVRELFAFCEREGIVDEDKRRELERFVDGE